MPPRTPDANTAGPVIVWFRSDLRLGDHPALVAAVETGRPLVLVYVFDTETPGLRRLGGASRWWLDGSLRSLSAEIERHGAVLHVFSGAPDDILRRIAKASGATAIVWSRRYAVEERVADRRIEDLLRQAGLDVRTFNGSLGHEPGEVKPASGGWYKVYSAYWKAAEAGRPIEEPLAAPKHLQAAPPLAKSLGAVTIDDLGLRPKTPDWSEGLAATWTPGEAEAARKLRLFAADKIPAYAIDRDRPGVEGSSRLSPHLRFGEISPRQIAAAVRGSSQSTKFRQELAWRDFCYGALAHVADLGTESFDRKFRHFPAARPPASALKAWRRGQTGYPIVDAGMRQLWRTGWMHNRVRMITASFLIKDLLADWRDGERWFWDTLCDADPANNAFNWQWVAGTGPDAAPFFRVFSPVTQGEKFDPEGTYVKAFVPELENLPARWIHKPWEAPADLLRQAKIELGATYPRPIVDHAEARLRALSAYEALRNGGASLARDGS